MKFRTKLLILLLTVTLLPLGLSFIAQQASVHHFGNKLAGNIQSLLQGNAQTLLHTLTDHYCQVLKRDKAMAQMSLRVQAQAVESRLLSNPPQIPPPIYYAPDFLSANRQPPDVSPSSRHQRLTSQGDLEPIPVSYTHQVVFLPQGVERQDVQDQILRLSSMSQVYRSLHQIQPDLFLWQYTTLESGIHSSYPGKGAYPPDYDPRERLWYQEAMEAQEPIQKMMTDVSTGALILTLAVPVHTQDGSPAGVTALDIDYRQFFADWKIRMNGKNRPTAWSWSIIRITGEPLIANWKSSCITAERTEPAIGVFQWKRDFWASLIPNCFGSWKMCEPAGPGAHTVLPGRKKLIGIRLQDRE